MKKISAAGLLTFALLIAPTAGRAFDRDRDRDSGWGAPYNSHLDAYSGRPLGPPLTQLPWGYDYYNGRLVRVPYPGPRRAYVPYSGPRYSARPHRHSFRGRGSRRR